MDSSRRKFLKDALIITGVVMAGGSLIKSSLDEIVDSSEEFEGFDEEKVDGWRVAECQIPTQGDVVYVTPHSKSQLIKITKSKDEVSYSGWLKYKIKKTYSGIPEKDLWDVRPGYVILKKNK